MEKFNFSSVESGELMQTYSNECATLGHLLTQLELLEVRARTLQDDRYKLTESVNNAKKKCIELAKEVNLRSKV